MRSLFSKRFLAITFILMPIYSQGQNFNYTLEHCKSHGGEHECVDRIEGIGEYIPSLSTFNTNICGAMNGLAEAHGNSHNFKLTPHKDAGDLSNPPSGYKGLLYCGSSEYEGLMNVFFQVHYACPAGYPRVHSELGNSRSQILKCVNPEFECECNENKSNGFCVPMKKKITVSTRPDGTYIWEYDSNNHEAERCDYVFVGESDGSICSNQNSNDQNTFSSSSSKVGNPIDCATGQKVQTEVDYIGHGVDPIRYSRYYETEKNAGVRSLHNSLGLSNKWSAKRTPTQLAFHDDYGTEVRILTNNSGLRRVIYRTSSTSSWKRNYYFSPIQYAKSGSTNVFTLESGDSYQFTQDVDTGNESVVKKKKNIDRYFYEYFNMDDEKLISRISNRFGRFIEFSYNENNQMKSLTDQDGITIQYAYDSLGNLTTVTYPDTTPEDVSDNPTRQYLFENSEFPNHLTGIVDENGHRYATFQYDEQGRAISTEHNQGAEKVVVSYPEEGKAIVQHFLDNDHFREEHITFEIIRGRYQLTSKEIVKCHDCVKGTEYWEYSQGLKSRHIDYDGTITKWTHHSNKKLAYEYRAFGVSGQQQSVRYTWDTQYPDKVKTMTTATQVTTYEYDQHGNLTSTQVTER